MFLCGFYLSLPFVIKTLLEKVSKNSEFAITVEDIKQDFLHFHISKFQLLKNQESILDVPELQITLSPKSLLKGNLILEKIFSDKGPLINARIKYSFYSQIFSFSGDVDALEQRGIKALGILCDFNLGDDNKVNLVIHHLNIFGKEFQNSCFSLAEEQFHFSMNNMKGQGRAVVQNSLLLLDGRFFHFGFPSYSLIFSGKYNMEKHGFHHASIMEISNSNIDLLFKIDHQKILLDKLKLQDTLFDLDSKVDYFIFDWATKTLKSNLHLITKNTDQQIEQELKFSGQYANQNYDFQVASKGLLDLSFLKFKDITLSLKGKKGEGALNFSATNAEKTNISLNTLYKVETQKIIFVQPKIKGIYKDYQFDSDKFEWEFSPKSKGHLNLKFRNEGFLNVAIDGEDTRLKTKNLPMGIFNSFLKSYNLNVEDGLITSEVVLAGDNVAADVNIQSLKHFLLGEKKGTVLAKLSIKSNVLNTTLDAFFDINNKLSWSFESSSCKGLCLDSLKGKIQGQFRLENVEDFLDRHDDTISGNLSIDLHKNAHKDLFGSVLLSQAFFLNSRTGAVFKDLTMSFSRAEKDKAFSFKLQSSDGEKGKIYGGGNANISLKHLSLETTISLNLQGFKILNTDQDKAFVSGKIDYTKKEKTSLHGTLILDDFQGYMIPKGGSESFNVRVLNSRNQSDAIQLVDGLRRNICYLDLVIKIPNTLRFYGSGLESFWNGDLKIEGNTQKPIPRGSLKVTKGYFIFAGKKLPLLEGYMKFDETFDPYLEVIADAKATNITAKIFYHGLLSNSKLDIVSTPPLNQEEILAQVIFGKSASQIKSTYQLIQLGDAIAVFNGKASLTGFLDKFSEIFSIDEFGIREDTTNPSPQNPDQSVIALEKNLGEKFFLRGERVLSTTDPKTRGILGLKLTPEISLEVIGERPDTPTTQDTQNFGIGLEWKKDY